MDDALDLVDELAKSNRYLQKATDAERRDLYEITNGNPLLIRWVAGQLGRTGSQCRTIAEACAFLKTAPSDNDPLEYIFGDLLDTFSESETAVLAALAHFTGPAKVDWVAELTRLARPIALTALEDLADRALLISDPDVQTFFLPPLAATFLRRKRPEAIAQTGNHLSNCAYSLARKNGYKRFDRFPILEAEWPTLAAALPLLMRSSNAHVQRVCHALNKFLNFSGRWDERMALSEQALERAVAAGDWLNAGWQSYTIGMIYCRRGQAAEALDCASRCELHWKKARKAGAREKAVVLRLRGIGHRLQKTYPAAQMASQEALNLWRTIEPGSRDVARELNSLAEVKRLQSDYAAAERDYYEALHIAKKISYREGVATCIGNLAELALDREDWAGAEALAHEALELSEKLRRQELIGEDCQRLAKAMFRQGKAAEGLPYARRAVEIFTKLGKQDGLANARATLKECYG